MPEKKFIRCAPTLAIEPMAFALESSESFAISPLRFRRSDLLMRVLCNIVIVFALPIATAVPLFAGERMRLWVDANGVHSVQAELLEVLEEKVVLRRSDGKQISLAIEMLSDEDKSYIEKITAVDQDSADGPQVRTARPEPKQYPSLPEIRLPASNGIRSERQSLAPSSRSVSKLPTVAPGILPADPGTTNHPIKPVQIGIPRLSYGESFSRPILVPMSGNDGTTELALVCSISSRSVIPGESDGARLLRFDVDAERAYVVHEHDDTLRILDHDPKSGNSLLHIGFNSMSSGGEIAVGHGWDAQPFKIDRRKSLSDQASGDLATYQSSLTMRKRHLRWARWVDSEHMIAIIDQSLGLWNLRSGEQVYAIGTIDDSSVPALSAGRHYLAVPYAGNVQVFATATGKPLGRIESGRQTPGVAFSPVGDQLAIATSRRLICWDLTAAAIVTDIGTRRSLGRHSPIWIDFDLVLTSSGVLISRFRGLPIWRYDVDAETSTPLGNHLAIMRKQPLTALTIMPIPHPGARDAIDHIDSIHVPIDHDRWQIAGRSDWQAEGWIDRDVRISAVPQEESAENR